jgi:hypothetical protein
MPGKGRAEAAKRVKRGFVATPGGRAAELRPTKPESGRPTMNKITIHPVSRIEGHAKITIRLDDAGEVTGTQFHVTQIRGFEKFTEGRPYYEMPSITARICGICPVSHLLASVKACDEIMAVRIPEAAAKLRELLHCAQFTQSHALSFFHLSAPDLLLGMDYDPAKRNVAGLLEEHPDALRDGIALRKFGQQVIERLAKERIHPSWTVPGGVNAPLDPHAREKILAELPAAQTIVRRTIELWKKTLDGFPDEIASFSNFPTMYAGLVGPDGSLRLYDGKLRFVGPEGRVIADQVRPDDYATYIGEARGVPPAPRPHRPERLPLPLRAPDRDHLRPRAHAAAPGRPGDPLAEGPRPCRRQQPRRRRHDRGPARHPDPPLQGRRQRGDGLGEPDRRHGPQQPRDRQGRRAGREEVRPRQEAAGRRAQSGVGAGAGL